MRVIAGEFKGRPIKAPKGSNTRPTTDRVRESLFSTLASARGGFDGAVVLDAFAGSGALGIEALSRGASYAVFCEQNRAALGALKDNLSFVDTGRYALIAGDVFKRQLPTTQAFDLLFFDPPYAYPAASVTQIIERLCAAGQLEKGALVSYEFNSDDTNTPVLGTSAQCGLEYVTRKTFGTTAIDVYRKG